MKHVGRLLLAAIAAPFIAIGIGLYVGFGVALEQLEGDE